MFPRVFRGHSFSLFSITWRKFSVSFHSSSNLWSESPGPGTPCRGPFACAQTHASFPVFSLILMQQVQAEQDMTVRGNVANNSESSYSESRAHLLSFISADKWYDLLCNAESGAGAGLEQVEEKRHLASVFTVNQQLVWPLQVLDHLFSLIKAFPPMRLWVWI